MMMCVDTYASDDWGKWLGKLCLEQYGNRGFEESDGRLVFGNVVAKLCWWPVAVSIATATTCSELQLFIVSCSLFVWSSNNT